LKSAPTVIDKRRLQLLQNQPTYFLCEAADMFRLPDFSVVVWLRKTEEFATLRARLLDAAVAEPYESTEYQGMVDFHWGAASFGEAKRLADAMKEVALRPELIVLRVMSRVDGVESLSLKDERRTKH
jgi:hypothetical protein